MSQSTYTVSGMTCGHCVASVTGEISGIDGVTDVAVDLPTGAVTVTSGTPLDQPDVRSAVEVAGYRLTAERPAGDRDRTETIR
jgi:copper chaperone CopZ